VIQTPIIIAITSLVKIDLYNLDIQLFKRIIHPGQMQNLKSQEINFIQHTMANLRQNQGHPLPRGLWKNRNYQLFESEMSKRSLLTIFTKLQKNRKKAI